MTFVDQVDLPASWQGVARQGQNSPDTALGDAAISDNGGFLARDRRRSLMSRVVEAEILPRLSLASAGARQATPEPAGVTTENDTVELVRLLIGKDDNTAWLFIESLTLRGATPAALYLGVVTQAARQLGELWEQDFCDFTQVTVSLGRLQQIVRTLSPSFQDAAVNQSPYADTVLLLPAPGEQHTLGLVILSEFFRREGWHVVGGPVSDGIGTVELVRTTWVDVAGFSVGSLRHLDRLAATIRAVRAASRNRHIGVMVGGPLLLEQPDLVKRVGADTTATDAPGTMRLAKTLLLMRAVAG